jgi:hypothetical protein
MLSAMNTSYFALMFLVYEGNKSLFRGMLYIYRVLVNQLYYFEEYQVVCVKDLHIMIKLSFVQPEG